MNPSTQQALLDLNAKIDEETAKISRATAVRTQLESERRRLDGPPIAKAAVQPLTWIVVGLAALACAWVMGDSAAEPTTARRPTPRMELLNEPPPAPEHLVRDSQ